MTSPSTLKRFPEFIGGYRMPDPVANVDDADRIDHRDLPGMAAAELVMERSRVIRTMATRSVERCCIHTLRAPYFEAADLWLVSRMRAIAGETERRRGRS